MGLFDIVMFGYGDWSLWEKEGHRVRNAKLCLHLARSDRVRSVAVVSDPPAFSPAGVSIGKYAAAAVRTMPLRARWREVSDKVTSIEPSILAALPHRLRIPVLVRTVARFCSDRGIVDPVLWIANPCKVFPIGRIDSSCVVFDAIDDWELIDEYGPIRERIAQGYAEVKSRADIIFTVSELLLEKFRDARARTVRHVPNAVDAERFAPPGGPPRRERSGPPVLTYVGIIHGRFDETLVVSVARAFPEAIVRVIGPIWSPSIESTLSSAPNIELTGFVHHGEIPTALHESDVLLMPHRIEGASRTMSPLKLYEYLATGKPVVTTPVPPADTLGDLLYLAEGPEAFIRQVRRALDERKAPGARALAERRMALARKNSWTLRVETILDDIEALTSGAAN